TLPAFHRSREDEVAGERVVCALIDRPCRLHLVRREAIGGERARALRRAGVPVACTRIGEEGVGGQAAARYRTGRQHGIGDELLLTRSEEALRRGVHGLVV